MRIAATLLLSAFLQTIAGHAAAAQTEAHRCHYLPQFRTLLKRLPSMTALDALNALNNYQGAPANNNPEACEALEIDRLMTEREIQLVYLADGKDKLFAQSSEHCDALQGDALKCNGAKEDATARPLSRGIFPMKRAETSSLVTIKSDIPGMEISSVAVGTPAEIAEGKAVQRIPADQGKLDLHSLPPGSVLMVVFQGSAIWKYHKFVWYFE